jgi:glycosyltransferase involved in cell wall biosynthesis
LKTIFISIPWFRPAYKAGGPVQSIANLVESFTEDVQYRIFCSATDLNNEPLLNIETGNWVDYNAYTKVWYASAKNKSETLLQLVKQEKPDVLYIIGLYDWHFNLVPLLFCEAKKKIVSVRGMLHPGALSQKRWKKNIFLRSWKIAGLHKKVVFHATDEKEEGFIKAVFGPKVKVDIAGNFPRKLVKAENITKQYGILRLLSIALISPMKNHLLVLNALTQTNYKVTYDIYGPVKDMEYWNECLETLKKFAWNIRVNYHGNLEPRFVNEALQEADLFILPSKSENYGHSIIEALSAGVPVITSNNTPWNGLAESGAGRNVELTEDAVAGAIEEFIKLDKAQYTPYQQAAIDYAANHTDIPLLVKQYKKMFEL